MLACHGFSPTSRANGFSEGIRNMTPPAPRLSSRVHQKGTQDQSEHLKLAFNLRSVDRIAKKPSTGKMAPYNVELPSNQPKHRYREILKSWIYSMNGIAGHRSVCVEEEKRKKSERKNFGFYFAALR